MAKARLCSIPDKRICEAYYGAIQDTGKERRGATFRRIIPEIGKDENDNFRVES